MRFGPIGEGLSRIEKTNYRLAACGAGLALKRKGFTTRTIIPEGKSLQLMDAANLSLGGTTIDVTAMVHVSIVAIARRAAEAMDLRFCGIDILARDAREPCDDAVVLEVNSAPGLDNYLYRGPKNTEYVDGLYLRVLEAVANGPAGSRRPNHRD